MYFRCLHRTGGILQLLPATSCQVVMACAVLHNMAEKSNAPQPDIVDYVDEADEDDEDRQDGRNGVRTRENLIRQHFS